MALSYKHQLVFTDDRSRSVTVNIGDIVEIKGHELSTKGTTKMIGQIADCDFREYPYTIEVVNENSKYAFNLDTIESIEKTHWTDKMVKGITENMQQKYPNIQLKFEGNADYMTIYWSSKDENKEELTEDEYDTLLVATSKYLPREDIKNKLCVIEEE